MISLYIHIPFCQKKCFYCSFVVSVGQQHRMDLYLDCLAREAEIYKGKRVGTVYIGGGTPTLLNEEQLKKLFGLIKSNFFVDNQAEWTIEANPEGMSLEKGQGLKKLGANRISLGVQSFNDRYLRYLGRVHDKQKALEAYASIREAKFDNVNVDLMFSFKGQTRDELNGELKELTLLKSEHVSLYNLTIEQNSRFYVQKVNLEDDQKQAEQYTLVMEWLEKAGFHQYEVSNFARSNFESQHNLNYWKGGNYIGLGVGAHSHFNGKRFWNTSRFLDYIERIQGGRSPEEGCEWLNQQQRFMETFLFGLRMNEGIDISMLQERFDYTIDQERLNIIEGFICANYLERQGSHLKVSHKGRLVLDELSASLI